jgi:hypothetical protein
MYQGANVGKSLKTAFPANNVVYHDKMAVTNDAV